VATTQTWNGSTCSSGQRHSPTSTRSTLGLAVLLSIACSSMALTEEYPEPAMQIPAEVDAALGEVARVVKERGVTRVDSIIFVPEEGDEVFQFQSGEISTENYKVDFEVLVVPKGTGNPNNPDMINAFRKVTITYWTNPKTKVTCGEHLASRRNCTQTN
jgi:hypothetical protein